MLWMKTSGWYDVRKWILSFGAEARVLEPEHLQDKVRNEVAMMFKGYGGTVVHTEEINISKNPPNSSFNSCDKFKLK